MGEELIPMNWETHFVKEISDVWHEEGDVYVKLPVHVLLRLRPVLYYEVGWDSGDSNLSGLFKNEYKTISDLLNQPKKNFNGFSSAVYHTIEFRKGQPCGILIPNKRQNGIWYLGYNGREKKQQWQWTGDFRNIHLNFYETSVNQEPLRTNLWEHPRKPFYKSAYPNSAIFESTEYSHLVEADIIEFTDLVKSIEGDRIQCLNSKINARIVPEVAEAEILETWDKEDLITFIYLDEGIYEAWNCSKKGSSAKVYLSDPIYSDLREFHIIQGK
jgi:hypothetical protein